MPLQPKIPAPLRTPLVDAAGIVDRAWASYFQQLFTESVTATVKYGTHAARLLVDITTLADGTQWIETDRGNVVYQAQNGAWAYAAGSLYVTQAQLAGIQKGLGQADTGLLASIADFAHVLRWSGSAFQFGPGDAGGGYIQPFLLDIDPGPGWALCDGGTTYFLNADGSISQAQLPDLGNNNAYLKFGATPSVVLNPPIAPKLKMDLYTPQGTNSAPVMKIGGNPGPFTPAGTIGAITPAGTVSSILATTDGSFAITNGTSGTVFSCTTQTHTHPAPTFTGTQVTPVFTGTPYNPTITAPIFTGTPVAPTGKVSATAEPQNVVLRAYFRR